MMFGLPKVSTLHEYDSTVGESVSLAGAVIEFHVYDCSVGVTLLSSIEVAAFAVDVAKVAKLIGFTESVSSLAVKAQALQRKSFRLVGLSA